MAWGLLSILACLDAQAAAAKRVLVLHSFGREFAPFDTVSAVLRTELARRYPGPITFVDANLDLRRGANEREEQVFVSYLDARFDDGAPDVVITLGFRAALFYTTHRDRLFPAAPLLAGALDERTARGLSMRPGDAVAAVNTDLPRLVVNIVELLPRTKNIFAVFGASDNERFWADQMKRDVAAFDGRLRFEYLNDLPLVQMKERVASLPPDSAILYGLMIVDAAGVPQERQQALTILSAAANAPIFGVYESELGHGVVGGPYMSQRRNAERIVSAALRMLDGRSPEEPAFQVDGFERPVYDARELARWNIGGERLPPGSEIRFGHPPMWEGHREAVIAAGSALVLQAALIAAMLVHGARRRRAELDAEWLAGRLVTAHEDERRRLARELHDDVSQRLAGLAIEAADLERRQRESHAADTAHAIRKGLSELGEDIHALSYRLHPSVIEDLGLAEALRIEADRLAQQGKARIDLDLGGIRGALPADAALCLFRIAQEALRNAERHAAASRVAVRIVAADRGLTLTVRDDGAGFDPHGQRERASLGLASMRERVRSMGGRLRIESEPGRGTVVEAWIPVETAT